MSAAILPDPRNLEYVHPLSVEAYHALGEMGHLNKNTELLYGVVFTKMPKSPLHSSIFGRVAKLVREAISPDHYVIRTEQPITCSDSEPEPDVAVIAGSEGDFWECHPTTAELVIEIAITSEEYDRNKALAYARAGVKEFWIVLANTRQIEIHRKPGPGGYADISSVASDGVAESTVVSGIRIDVSALFAH